MGVDALPQAHRPFRVGGVFSISRVPLPGHIPITVQWSPADEGITALIREMGPENVPVVTMVVETEAGRIM